MAAGKGVAHPLMRDAPAAPESVVREHFNLIYPKGRSGKNGELSPGAIRQAWYKVTKELPPDIRTDNVDGVVHLYVGCHRISSNADGRPPAQMPTTRVQANRCIKSGSRKLSASLRHSTSRSDAMIAFRQSGENGREASPRHPTLRTG